MISKTLESDINSLIYTWFTLKSPGDILAPKNLAVLLIQSLHRFALNV